MTAPARAERVGALHRFFGWLLKEGLITEDPTAPLFNVRPARTGREAVNIDLIVRFVDEALAGLSPLTIQTRQGTLLRFARWLQPRSLLEATTGDVVAWLDELGVAARTRGERSNQLHAFYNWALNNGVVDRDPVAPLLHVRRPLNAGDFPELERGWWIAMERKTLKPSSIKSRALLLRSFYDWMAPKSIIDATTKDIELWLDARKIGSKSRYTSISNLHMFYRWAQREGLVGNDPTADMDRPRVSQTVPRPISDANLVLGLDRADLVTWAILAVAAFEGMRAGEIAGLRREDILDHLEPPMLIVSAPKGHRERTLPLHPEAWKALQPILPRSGPVFRWTTDRKEGGRQKAPLLGRQWPAWKVSHTANLHLAGLGIPSSLHKLRSWYATKVYAASLDLASPKSYSGLRRRPRPPSTPNTTRPALSRPSPSSASDESRPQLHVP